MFIYLFIHLFGPSIIVVSLFQALCLLGWAKGEGGKRKNKGDLEKKVGEVTNSSPFFLLFFVAAPRNRLQFGTYMYLSHLLFADHSFTVFRFILVISLLMFLFFICFVFSVLLPKRDLCCPNTLVGLNGIQQITSWKQKLCQCHTE